MSPAVAEVVSTITEAAVVFVLQTLSNLVKPLLVAYRHCKISIASLLAGCSKVSGKTRHLRCDPRSAELHMLGRVLSAVYIGQELLLQVVIALNNLQYLVVLTRFHTLGFNRSYFC